MSAVAELVPAMATRRALRALGAAHATWYRRRRAARGPAVVRSRPAPPLALSSSERQCIVATLNSARFADCTPYTAWARLLDEGTYLASVRTFYRVLAAEGLVHERRQQLVHPAHTKPELVAMTLPWFHVHQKFGTFLMNGGRNGQESVGSESALHGGVQD